MSTNNPTTLPIDQLQPNPFQPREKIKKEELSELVQSVKNYGILEPLVIAQTPAGYQIIAGERRWRAAKEAGLEEVPVVVKKTTPRGMLEMAIVENVQRSNLSPMERARAFKQLMSDFNFSSADISKQIGKSPSFVSNSLRLLELPDAIKDGLVGMLITEGHARALAGIKDEQVMVDCYKVILKESASVRRAEELVRLFKEKNEQKPSNQGRPHQIPKEDLEKWQGNMRQIFRNKSNLKLIRSNRQTRISITLKGSPEQTQSDLDKFIDLITSKAS